MSGTFTYYDETCLDCDSYDIKMNKRNDGTVDYKCRECGHVWSSDSE